MTRHSEMKCEDCNHEVIGQPEWTSTHEIKLTCVMCQAEIELDLRPLVIEKGWEM